MKHDYTKLDAAILGHIKSIGPVSFTRMQVGSVREEAEKLSAARAPFSTHYKPAWRFIDGRLQALRKAGKIRYQRKPEGWSLTTKEPTNDR